METFIGILIFVAIIIVASIPGIIATRRKHKNKLPIKILGYCGIFTYGVLTFVAFIWSLTPPD